MIRAAGYTNKPTASFNLYNLKQCYLFVFDMSQFLNISTSNTAHVHVRAQLEKKILHVLYFGSRNIYYTVAHATSIREFIPLYCHTYFAYFELSLFYLRSILSKSFFSQVNLPSRKVKEANAYAHIQSAELCSLFRFTNKNFFTNAWRQRKKVVSINGRRKEMLMMTKKKQEEIQTIQQKGRK